MGRKSEENENFPMDLFKSMGEKGLAKTNANSSFNSFLLVLLHRWHNNVKRESFVYGVTLWIVLFITLSSH